MRLVYAALSKAKPSVGLVLLKGMVLKLVLKYWKMKVLTLSDNHLI
jgi:hypothetical protein